MGNATSRPDAVRYAASGPRQIVKDPPQRVGVMNRPERTAPNPYRHGVFAIPDRSQAP